ncbi:MAG: EamA family transporter [Hyphomicrobiales bacterium]
MTKTRGTALGLFAILSWSCYGVLIAANSATPPFLSTAIVFTFATATLLARRLLMGGSLRDLFTIPLPTLALGFTGLFGSNCFYVLALALGGNPVTVNIGSLTWPAFMVVFIVVFGVARATWLDGLAMLLGLAGVVVLVSKGAGISFELPVLLALFAALSWAIYSALRTRVPASPKDAMIAFVATSAIACWAITLAFETGTAPGIEILRLAAVGILPVGLANLAWDIGARHGDPVLLAGLSFMEPVLSTALTAYALSRPVGAGDAIALALVLAAVLCSIMSERLRRRLASPPTAA